MSACVPRVRMRTILTRVEAYSLMWSFRLEKGSDHFMEVILIQPPSYCSQAYLAHGWPDYWGSTVCCLSVWWTMGTRDFCFYSNRIHFSWIRYKQQDSTSWTHTGRHRLSSSRRVVAGPSKVGGAPSRGAHGMGTVWLEWEWDIMNRICLED